MTGNQFFIRKVKFESNGYHGQVLAIYGYDQDTNRVFRATFAELPDHAKVREELQKEKDKWIQANKEDHFIRQLLGTYV